MLQLDLFAIDKSEAIRLRVAAEQARLREAANRLVMRRIGSPLCFAQLDIWGDVVEVCVAPPRRLVPARKQPETIQAGPMAAASVFALAASGHALGHKLWRQPASEPAPYRVERDGDRTRLVRMRPEETEEWQERERIRRAKQRPPRPPKGAKTRGKKLLELIGPGEDE